MRLGTRRSALALAQARHVAELIGEAELVPMATRGDRAPGRPGEDKSRWVAELEKALLNGDIDLAVHSAKDVPGRLPEGLELLGAPPRAGAEDALCGAPSLDSLPPGARLGTSSLRRAAQLRAVREDICVVTLRGNVDTRLRRLAGGDVQALVLARAGLQRLGREDAAGCLLDPRRFVPAPGQGTIALEGRSGDGPAALAAARISDPDAMACLAAERALAAALDAGCETPLGAHCRVGPGGSLLLRVWAGTPDGAEWISDELEGPRSEPVELAGELAARLRAVGAAELLLRARELAGAPGS
jgi:hydroxymethylbilane synthase